MRLSPAIVIGAFALAACGEREAAPTPAEKVAAAAKPSDAVQTAPEVLNAADLRRVCRAGLAAVDGQEPMAINVDGAMSPSTTVRSTKLRSSRTLPGQSWFTSMANSAGGISGGSCTRSLDAKCLTSRGISSFRSRSGGSRTLITDSR